MRSFAPRPTHRPGARAPLAGSRPPLLAGALALLAGSAQAAGFSVLEASRDLPASIRVLHEGHAADCRDKPAADRPRVETFPLDEGHTAFLIFCHDDGLNAVRYGYVASGPDLAHAAPLAPQGAQAPRSGRLEGYYTWNPRQRRLHLWTFAAAADCTRHEDWRWQEGAFRVAGRSLDCDGVPGATGALPPREPAMLVRESGRR